MVTYTDAAGAARAREVIAEPGEPLAHTSGARSLDAPALDAVALLVAAGLAFCSIDFRGHGRSGGGMLGLTLERNLEDVRHAHELLIERGYEKVIVFGSSMGGWIALLLARKLAPAGRLAGLVVIRLPAARSA